ncbi:MAG: family 43 glycosylhydrolase [Phycisphaerae bacterium]
MGDLQSTGGNPLIPDIGMSDPHVRVFDGQLYLYTGCDESPEDRTWVMRKWQVYRSGDLVHWSHQADITPDVTRMDENSSDCWACDAMQRNGKTYFYYSDRNRHIGVLVADSPAGPFTSPRDSWLVDQHDPTILVDDDPAATPYMVYGAKEHGGYFVVRLNNDMISLASEPRSVEILGRGWAEAPDWMDKNYIFKARGRYYLSWGADYATSDNIYGPYTWQGRVGSGYELGPFAHGSFFGWRGQFYHIWCRYIRPGYKYRESLLTYCHLCDDGELITDTRLLDRHFATGVGRYDASWDRIEAEWFTEAPAHAAKQKIDDQNLAVTNLRDGDTLVFANVDFASRPGTFQLQIAGDVARGLVEIRLDELDSAPIGCASLPGGKSALPVHPSGTHDLLLTVRVPGSGQLALDSLRFTS